MTPSYMPTLVALVIQLTLAFVVFQSNRTRKANQCFLLTSILAAAWVITLRCAVTATNGTAAALWIRSASIFGFLILGSLNLLRISLRRPDEPWRAILWRSLGWLATSAGVGVLCFTSYFLRDVRIVGNMAVPPEPIYGPGILAYVYIFAGAAITLIALSIRDIQTASGVQRNELGFCLLGGVLAVGLAPLMTVLLRPFIAQSRLLWFAPFRVVFFSVLVAYGISTRKMMDVGTLVRRIMSYVVLAGYLLALYALVWWLVATALASVTHDSDHVAHIVAAIVVAFAMAPARGISQRLAERLFISSHQLDFRATVNKAADILTSVTTLRDLLARFGDTIANAVGAERVSILLPTRGGFRTSYATAAALPSERECFLPSDSGLVSHLQTNREPVVLHELGRMRPTREVIGLTVRLKELNVALAIGIFSREHLTGVMLLGPRRSGRIYGTAEQETLQVIGRQLAVAIENAELFTEVQNAKNYNETLLENLTTGVIAAGTDGVVTVFNNEAGQITDLHTNKVIGHSIDELPEPVSELLRQTLTSGEPQEDRELILRFEDGATVVRGSTSIFHGEDRKLLGALMVLTDITALKRLEMQIRRSDRLASLGTLSAGMAHEIKNPLVSIKTFAQLLPERYNDSDFRDTFSNLIGHEIDRIDTLVNQLLRFARPAKPLLQSVHLHGILEKSLLLVGHRLYQKDIKLSKSWRAELDTIRADPDQLEQVFLNFFINAMDAMKNGGELTVTTAISEDAKWMSALSHQNGDTSDILRVTIRDTGEGIRSEDIPHVFDPFFTTKDYGTGLGLSVVHGIIQEHGGQIEVESELHKGTAFHILLPLVHFEQRAAVA